MVHSSNVYVQSTTQSQFWVKVEFSPNNIIHKSPFIQWNTGLLWYPFLDVPAARPDPPFPPERSQHCGPGGGAAEVAHRDRLPEVNRLDLPWYHLSLRDAIALAIWYHKRQKCRLNVINAGSRMPIYRIHMHTEYIQLHLFKNIHSRMFRLKLCIRVGTSSRTPQNCCLRSGSTVRTSEHNWRLSWKSEWL